MVTFIKSHGIWMWFRIKTMTQLVERSLMATYWFLICMHLFHAVAQNVL